MSTPNPEPDPPATADPPPVLDETGNLANDTTPVDVVGDASHFAGGVQVPPQQQTVPPVLTINPTE